MISIDEKKNKNLLVCVEAVDAKDPLMGHFVIWLKKASEVFGNIIVLALRVGESDLPQNIKIYCLKERYKDGIFSRLETIYKLYFYSIKFRKLYDGVFSRGEPKYVIICGWLWKLMGKKVVLFFAHYKTSMLAKIANKMADVTTTSVPEAAIGLKTVLVGQAIDAELFKLNSIHRYAGGGKRFLVFGRVSEAKRVVEIIQAFKNNELMGATLTIVGKPLMENYALRVRREIEGAKMIKWIEENVFYEKVPILYRDYDVLINFTPGSLDKTIIEASLSGLLVIASSGGYNRLLEDDQKFLCPQSVDTLASTIRKIINTSRREDMDLAMGIRRKTIMAHALTLSVIKIFNLI